MSKLRTSRLKRGKSPRKANGQVRVLTENTYRKSSKKEIERDFGKRCAYSMVHEDHADGASGMEIDHFNPTLTGRRRHVYGNLFPGAGSCNLSKSNTWPDADDLAVGMRYLNPCKEIDYGEHIFEERESGLLVATSTAGFYQIVNLGLNDSHFVRLRLDRTDLCERLYSNMFALRDRLADVENLEHVEVVIKSLNVQLSKMIPFIPEPPYGAELYRTDI